MAQGSYSLSKDGKSLIITLPLEENPTASSTGKSLTVASTRGNAVTDLLHPTLGQVIRVGVNAYVPAPAK